MIRRSEGAGLRDGGAYRGRGGAYRNPRPVKTISQSGWCGFERLNWFKSCKYKQKNKCHILQPHLHISNSPPGGAVAVVTTLSYEFFGVFLLKGLYSLGKWVLGSSGRGLGSKGWGLWASGRGVGSMVSALLIHTFSLMGWVLEVGVVRGRA